MRVTFFFTREYQISNRDVRIKNKYGPRASDELPSRSLKMIKIQDSIKHGQQIDLINCIAMTTEISSLLVQ